MSLEEGDGIRGRWYYDSAAGRLVESRPSTNIYTTPAIHQDTIAPTLHPATGEVFESKSAFRRVTREKGYVEVDCDRAWQQIGARKDPVIEGLKEDLEEVRYWYTAAAKGNRDYINANVPPELRDCEEDDIDKGIVR